MLLLIIKIFIASYDSFKLASSNIIKPPGTTLLYNSSNISNVAEYESTSNLSKDIFSIPDVGNESLTKPFKNFILS